MIYHQELAGTPKFSLIALIKSGVIAFGGNVTLKIYGTLDCTSGKRMHIKNRVFFATEQEAIAAGFRPCGHCLRTKYQTWKKKEKLRL